MPSPETTDTEAIDERLGELEPRCVLVSADDSDGEHPRVETRRLSLREATRRFLDERPLNMKEIVLLVAFYGLLIGAVTWVIIDLYY